MYDTTNVFNVNLYIYTNSFKNDSADIQKWTVCIFIVIQLVLHISANYSILTSTTVSIYNTC